MTIFKRDGFTLYRRLIIVAFWLHSSDRVVASHFGDVCLSQRDCVGDGYLKVTGVICNWASSSCGHGVCTCNTGYREDAENRRCRRVVKLGQQCWAEEGDVCEAQGAVCFHGMCQCSTGFKPGPLNTDCAPTNLNALKYGESCYYRVALFHDAYCPYNMVCTPAGCSCPPGFKLNPKNKYTCVPICLGERCETDVDCSQNLHSVCSKQHNSTCICRRHYRAVRHFSDDRSEFRCVRSDARLLVEGDYCGDAFPFGTPFLSMIGVCSPTYTCTACLGKHSPSRICGVRRKEQRPTSTALVPYEKRQRLLGDRCDNMYRSECVLPNTDCINGICQCLPGSGCVFRDYDSSATIYDVRRTGGLVGRACSADSDCAFDGSMVCQRVSSSCSRFPATNLGKHSGVCACAEPNFVERPHHVRDANFQRETISTCTQRLRLGELCTSSRGVCVAHNSDCLFGVCQCVQGFNIAPWSDECIPDEQMRYYGEKCLFSEECYYSQSFEFAMACLDNTCGCLAGTRPGMMNPDGPAYGCIPNRLGDRCMADMDCHLYWRYNWHCSTETQTCECNTGYYAARLSLRDGAESSQAWCVPYNASLQIEGARCKQRIQDIEVSNICASPLVCSSCDDVYSDDGVCGWPPPAQLKIPTTATISSRTKGQQNTHTCVATPIDDDLQLLLAPSHCFPLDGSSSTSAISKSNLSVEVVSTTASGVNVSLVAEWLLRHPVVDVALLKYRTSSESSQSNLFRVLALPTPAFCQELFNCTISNDSYNATLPVEIVPTQRCRQEYGVTSPGTEILSPKTICAGRYPVSASTNCAMSSSLSPLTCLTPNGRKVVAGLPLKLNKCAVAGLPRVFTRLCYALDWIQHARMIVSSLEPLESGRCQR